MMAPDSQPDPDEQTVNEPEEIEPIPALNIIEPGGFSSLISGSPSAPLLVRLVRDDSSSKKSRHVRTLVWHSLFDPLII
jgi:hypothetical protein